MNMEDFINELEDMLENSWSLPLSGGRTVIDARKVCDILDDLRLSIPKEVTQAKAIVSDRAQIIKDAKSEAETIVRIAEERAKAMVNQDEIVKKAQERATDILTEANTKSKEMKKAASDYVDDLMLRTDKLLADSLTEIRTARQNIKTSKRAE